MAAVTAALLVGPLPTASGAGGEAPGAPGQVANWTPGNKDGFGTSKTLASKVWFTLGDRELTEVYSPDVGTPSARDLQFVVSDGSAFTENERDDATHETQLIDPRSLTVAHEVWNHSLGQTWQRFLRREEEFL